MAYNKISLEKCEMIIRWYNEGKTICEISILMQEIPRTAINNIIKKFKDTGEIVVKRREVPRILKLTDDILEAVKIILKEDCTRNLKEIQNIILWRKKLV